MAVIENKQNETVFSGDMEFQKKNPMTNVSIETIPATVVLSKEWKELSFDERKGPMEEILNKKTPEIYYGTFNGKVEEKASLTFPINAGENKFCKNMPIDFVRKNLVYLTKNAKNKPAFLTEDQFELFIKRAFLGDQGTGKLVCNFGPGRTRKDFYAIFYNFYEKAKNEGCTNKKSEYEDLIIENFINCPASKVRGNIKAIS